MTSKPFDAFQVGDVATLTHVITQSDIEKFVALTGDDNPLHVDKKYAKTTVFKEPVAHGMLGASFISTIIGKHIPGDGALWMSQSFEFLLPVRIGDTLTISAKILEKHDSQRMFVLETDIINQHKQLVVRGQAKVKKMEQMAPE
ncbi:MaoC family dehydratase, partial [bacterium]|nr:MaoC family dehydratase [bacterium]